MRFHESDVRQMGHGFFEHLFPLGQREQRLGFLRVPQRGHHDLVEEPARPLHHLQVAVVKGIERARDESNGHEVPLCCDSSA